MLYIPHCLSHNFDKYAAVWGIVWNENIGQDKTLSTAILLEVESQVEN